MKIDPYTEAETPDWTKPPRSELATPIKVQPYSLRFSTEAVLTAGTVVSRWEAWLPPSFDGTIDSSWRVRWDGDDYDIDGEIGRWKTRGVVRYLTCTIKLVTG
ncbi:MAG: hypothetical protein ACR2JO_08060 [Mycobacteriales bacterium]